MSTADAFIARVAERSTAASAGLPLAEVQWTWRRIYTYLVTAAACGLLAWIIHRLTDPQALKAIGLALIAFMSLAQLFYLGGATITDLARLAAAVKAGASPGDKP